MLTTSPLLLEIFVKTAGKETRTITIEIGIIKESSRSYILTMEETKVIAWINGPKKSKGKTQENKGSVECFFTQAPFSSMLGKT